MNRWPQTVLFDFDGVIVNSEPLHFQAFREVLLQESVELSEDEYYDELIGFDDKGAFKFLFKKRDIPLTPKVLLSLMAHKSGVMMELIHRRQYAALPGVEEFVRGLWRNRPLAICSGALREEVETMLEAISLRDCFTVITAAEDVTHGKPDPEGYLLTVKRMSEKTHKRLEPKDCLVVEDAPSVIRAVKAVGFPALGVATSYEKEKLSDADWVVNSLRPEEVTAALPNLPLTM